MKLQKQDVDRLERILAEQANSQPIMPQMFLRNLVNGSGLPNRWTQEIAGTWTGNIPLDTRSLVKWAEAKGVNPEDKRYTTLGCIVRDLLDSVGFDTRIELVALIVRYGLYVDKREMDALLTAYQVPLPNHFIAQTIAIGPEIDWKGPTDAVELQSWFKPSPDFLDVGFLRRAIQQAASVCRIELPGQSIYGTGFLVAENLLLTNYHVLKPFEQADIEANARSAVLRFGYFSTDAENKGQGQTFGLVGDHPILASKPPSELDYVLLQVEDSIRQAEGIQPVLWDINPLSEHIGLNILQHPEGGTMKLAVSNDGVTGVYQQQGIIQYLTKTAGGSSGAPCFNEDWKVVALHHAERSKSFGVVREGILFSSIYEDIKAYLA